MPILELYHRITRHDMEAFNRRLEVQLEKLDDSNETGGMSGGELHQQSQERDTSRPNGNTGRS